MHYLNCLTQRNTKSLDKVGLKKCVYYLISVAAEGKQIINGFTFIDTNS